jgi:hypothetical protein
MYTGPSRYIYDTVGNFNHFRTLRTRAVMALETSVSSYFNQLMRLVAREDFILYKELPVRFNFVVLKFSTTFTLHEA